MRPKGTNGTGPPKPIGSLGTTGKRHAIRRKVAPGIWRYEHIIVMEERLGRPLRPGEVVHHIDGDWTNNDSRNLVVLTRGQHFKLHGVSSEQRRREAALVGLATFWTPEQRAARGAALKARWADPIWAAAQRLRIRASPCGRPKTPREA